MDARLSFVTLVVADVERSRQFYVESLGWAATFDVPGEVVMIRVGEKLILSLWAETSAEAEIGRIDRGAGALPFTLAHNVASVEAVDAAIAEAIEAGAILIAAPVHREWGGYSGYIADPDGFRWEIAFNPSQLGESLL